MRIGKVRISVSFVILIAVFYLLDYNAAFFATFLAVFIHEAAHIAAIRVFGGKIDYIEIKAFGIKAHVRELLYMPYAKEIIIAAAGPIAGIITAICAFAAARVLKTETLDYFIGVNIVITIINLIPVYPLDGGRIVLSLALWWFPVRVAYTISYILAILSIATLFAGCMLLAVSGSLNPSLLIFSIYVAFCGIKSHRLL